MVRTRLTRGKPGGEENQSCGYREFRTRIADSKFGASVLAQIHQPAALRFAADQAKFSQNLDGQNRAMSAASHQ